MDTEHPQNPQPKNEDLGAYLSFDDADCEVMELHGQRLMMHKEFGKILGRWGLTLQDIMSIAEIVCNGMISKGWFVPQRGLVFTVDKHPNPSGFCLMFCPVKREPDSPVDLTAVINADYQILEREREYAEKAARRNKWENEFSNVLRQNFLIKLAHELAHAFGINRTNDRFRALSIPDLEVVTDSVAFLSTEKEIGDAAYLGVTYLHGRLKEKGIEYSPATIRELGTSIIASIDKGCHPE